MNRVDLIRSHFDKSMRLIELGASYNPILPKAEGWQTTIIDHASQADLKQRYGGMGMEDLSRIEPVDFVWQSGQLSALVPEHLHGTFDGLVASHVGEHFPDLIAFFKSASLLLKPDGVIALALPDKRVCFDFFQPMTMTGDLIEAHAEKRTRHTKRTFFNQAAYFTVRDSIGGWAHTGNTAPFQLAQSLFSAQKGFEDASEDPNSLYSDTHAWTFTPKSFELLILELNLLGHIDWAIRAAEPASGIEFYAWLERRRISMPEPEVNAARLSLLTAMVHETQDAIDQLEEAGMITPEVTTRPRTVTGPGITAIIPLYNGSKYIEEALNSVFRQTLPPVEVIVVNDGSTDNGAGVAIVERLARSHPITLLHKLNGGQSSARNLGVKQSKTDLIALLDQDDVWYENHLEELAKPFRSRNSPPLGWVYSNLDEIDEDGFLVSRSYLSLLSAAHPKRHIYDCMRQDMFVLPSASLIRREAFEAIGGFDEELCGYEDDDLFLRMFRAGYDNLYLDQALSKWRIYPTSTSYTFRMARSRGIYVRKLLRSFPDDAKRARYYARDLILPRFIKHALNEHQIALKEGNLDAIRATWSEVSWLAEHNADLPPEAFEYALQHYDITQSNADEADIDAVWNEVAGLTARDEHFLKRLFDCAVSHYHKAVATGDQAQISTHWARLVRLANDDDRLKPFLFEPALRRYDAMLATADEAGIVAVWNELVELAAQDELFLRRLFDCELKHHNKVLLTGDQKQISAQWSRLVRAANNNEQMAPFMFGPALRHYRAALIQGDNAQITDAWTDVAVVTARMPRSSRRLRAALILLRNPAVSKAAFALRRVARPAMRWAFSA